jgi:hypothetical protein
MPGLMTAQGTTAPAPPGPAIPPVPTRPGAGTGATAAPATSAQQAGQEASEAAQAAAQAAADAVNQQLRVQQPGQPQIIIPPPYRSNRNEIPGEVIPLVGMAMGTVITIVLGYPIIRFIIRMVERKTDRGALAAKDVTAQLRALQDSIDTMAIELERISEGQRFTAKLMAEREQRALAQGEGHSR